MIKRRNYDNQYDNLHRRSSSNNWARVAAVRRARRHRVLALRLLRPLYLAPSWLPLERKLPRLSLGRNWNLKECSSYTYPTATSMYLFLFAFSNKNNYSSVPLSPSSPHSLYQTNWWRMRIKTYNEVNLADVQALLTNTRGHQSVISSLTKPLDNLERIRNVDDNLSSCFQRFHVTATLLQYMYKAVAPKFSGNWLLPHEHVLMG